MGSVIVGEGVEGLGAMLGDLVRANIERIPARAALLHGRAGRVNVYARDAGVRVGLLFAGGALRVMPGPLPGADLEIECDAETLMGLSGVPLRGGFPDATTPQGREIAAKMVRGELRVRGLWRRPGLLSRLQRLLSVA